MDVLGHVFRRFPAAIGFGFAGALAFVTDLALFNVLLFSGVGAEVSNVFAYLAGIVVNFLVNREVFLGSPQRVMETMKSVWRFLVVAGSSLAYVVALFSLANSFLEDLTVVETNAVRVLIIGSVTVIRFFVLRNWVFGGASLSSETEESRP